MAPPNSEYQPAPSLESLRCFLAASRHLNFRRSAHEVALTPTAFSERIRALERDLGVALFRRTTRRVELTSEGQALVPAAEHTLASAQACVAAVRAPEARAVRIRLGTRFELGLSWLIPAVSDFERLRTNFELDVYFGSGPDILERLERGALDAAVTSAPVARADWHAEVLHPEHYAFVASKRLLQKRPLRAVRDARSHTLLDVDETLPLARYLLSAVPALEFARTRFCGAGAAVLTRVRAGDGVAVLPRYMLDADLAARRLVRLLPRVALLSDSFRLVYRKNSAQAPALAEVAAFLRARPLT
jgi:LysR family glycine cleavage system transcriptional activator